jgi:16S rRNA processing protein RimM
MNLVWVGRIVKVQGSKGEVRIHLSEGGTDTFYQGNRVEVEDARGVRKTLTVQFSRSKKPLTIVSFQEIHSREEAQELVGSQVYVAPESLHPLPPDEFYWHQLRGLRVKTEKGDDLGVLEEIIPTGSNDVFVVRKDGREVLIPATDEVIEHIDLQEKTMTIRPLEGLLSEDDL